MGLSKDDRKFVLWVEETLVPDLKDSGHDYTAEDFERLIDIVRDLAYQIENPTGAKKRKK